MYPLFHETNQLVINSCTRAIHFEERRILRPLGFCPSIRIQIRAKSRRLPYSKAVPPISGSKGKKRKDIMKHFINMCST
eukprot:UN14649